MVILCTVVISVAGIHCICP